MSPLPVLHVSNVPPSPSCLVALSWVFSFYFQYKCILFLGNLSYLFCCCCIWILSCMSSHLCYRESRLYFLLMLVGFILDPCGVYSHKWLWSDPHHIYLKVHYLPQQLKIPLSCTKYIWVYSSTFSAIDLLVYIHLPVSHCFNYWAITVHCNIL